MNTGFESDGRAERARFGWMKLAGGAFAIGMALISVYLLAIRPWHLRWGATEEEVHRPMPGDEFVESPLLNATRAITIDVPPEAVWPRLVQMGQGRAGFYTYDWIENLAGMHIYSADRIIPEFQYLNVGDVVPTLAARGAPSRCSIPTGRWSWSPIPLSGASASP